MKYLVIPAYATHTFVNGDDHVNSLEADIFEGQRQKSYHNFVLGHCTIHTKKYYALEELKMDVKIEVDEYGLMSVTAWHKDDPSNKGSFTKTIKVDAEPNFKRADEYKELKEETDMMDVDQEKKMETKLGQYVNKLMELAFDEDLEDLHIQWEHYDEFIKGNPKIEQYEMVIKSIVKDINKYTEIKENISKKQKNNNNAMNDDNGNTMDSDNDVDHNDDVNIADAEARPSCN